MPAPKFLSDEPTLTDLLDRMDLVRDVGDTAAGCQPPCVLGVHGDWGSGKTSFLHVLHYYLTGECPPLTGLDCGVVMTKHWPEWTPKEHVAVIWFEAWRYQHEPAPVVALLHEIRAQLPTASKALAAAKKWLTVGVKSAIFNLGQVTNLIGFQASKVQETKEKWEKEHFAEQLPSHTLRQFLEDTLKKLLPEEAPVVNAPKPRLVVLIDDLDRCEPQTAYRLLEGIKIYLNLPNCVFVLGVNQAVIEASLAEQLAKEKAENPTDGARQRARDYMDKICKNFWQLPACRDLEKLVNHWMSESLKESPIYDKVLADVHVARQINCHRSLPANPRRIKAFVNTFARFLLSATGRGAQLVPPIPEACVVLAYLYQFHPEIYRVIEWDPAFYQELRSWCEMPPSPPPNPDSPPDPSILPIHELFRPLSRADVPIPDLSTPTPTTLDYRSTYPDPARGNVFRIQRFVRELGSNVNSAIIEQCLLR